MIARRLLLAATLLASLSLAGIGVARAERGTPDSPEFGFGGRVNPTNNLALQAVQASADLRLDWLSIDLDWAALWPDPSQPLKTQALDDLMAAARQYNFPVLISITHAPAWASSSAGPDPDLTSWFVINLARRYPDVMKSVELFPGSNTALGWGAPPNPQAYASLILSVENRLSAVGLPLLIVAGGLTPSFDGQLTDTIDDVRFLAELYQTAPDLKLPVISMRFPDITGDPTQSPSGAEHRTLRHYEEIRKVMADHGRAEDLIWITQLRAPSGTISPSDRAYTSPTAQAGWLVSTYQQLKSQLYIGVVYYDSLNPTDDGIAASSSLLQPDQTKHPFYPALKQLIELNILNSLPSPQLPGVKYKQLLKTLNRPPF